MVPIRLLVASIEARPCGHEGCEEPQPHVIDATVYRTAAGEELGHEDLKPGDAWIEPWSARRQAAEGEHSCPWSNCDGRHLIVKLPNGSTWNVDLRASNCALPKDTEHRCWTRTGDPAAGTLDVGKSGRTCAAGAGSIAHPGPPPWHGFLHGGRLVVA